MRDACRLLAAVLLLGAGAGARAADEGDVFGFLAEEAEVVSASRRVERQAESPVVVDILTREEIAASGAVHLWDLLRFRPGLDVLEGSSPLGHRGIVAIRGAPREVIRELLVLVDGRSVYSNADAGVYWDTLPVQLQDIERIEIVRGPNAALYGSNAATGVIHILTRRPRQAVSAELTGHGGSRDSYSGSAAVEHPFSRTGVRLSYTHREEDGWPAAAGAPLGDALRGDLLNARAILHPESRTQIDLWAGAAWHDFDVPAPMAPHWSFRQQFAAARLERGAREERGLQAQLSWQERLQDSTPFFAGELDLRERQFDAELLGRLGWADGRLSTTGGLSYRHASVRSPILFGDEPEQRNRIARAFVHQSARLAERFTLVAGLAVEATDTGGVQPAYQLSAVWRPTAGQTLRLVHALAPTIPAIGDLHRDWRPTQTTVASGNPEVEPERLHMFEGSYQGRWWRDRLRLGAAVFWTHTEDRVGVVVRREDGLNVLSPVNNNESTHRGGELELELIPAAGRRAWINYSFVRVTDAIGDPNYLGRAPEHKLNLGGWLQLGQAMSLGVRAGYKDVYTIRSITRQQGVHVPAHWRLDARVAYRPLRRLELFVAGSELFDRRHVEYADGLEVERSFHGGLTWTFERRE